MAHISGLGFMKHEFLIHVHYGKNVELQLSGSLRPLIVMSMKCNSRKRPSKPFHKKKAVRVTEHDVMSQNTETWKQKVDADLQQGNISDIKCFSLVRLNL